MKILYYDCFSGISGDMNLGALVDLGVPFSYISKELDKLGLNEEFEITCEKAIKNGIGGTKVTVRDLNFYNHNHVYGRTYKDIVTIIKNSRISDTAKEIALNIFNEIAVAEAKIHNKAISEVHFHEVGAIDSIIDIVGAAIAISYINPDIIKCSTIEIGYGMVKSAHGILPIPAPATAEILKNIPIKAENVPFEATTPTGAAILKGTSSEFTDKKNFKISKIGYGIGQKDNKIMANILRVFLGELESNKEDEEKELILECNIDDMRAEEYELLMERLLNANALDVFYTNILMKKQRPAIKLSVICNYKNKDILKNIIFNNSSTIGIREIDIDRTKLEREIIEIKSKYGFVPLKISKYNGHIIRVKPEYDYCKAIAIEKDISLNEVYNDILYTYKETKDRKRGI